MQNSSQSTKWPLYVCSSKIVYGLAIMLKVWWMDGTALNIIGEWILKTKPITICNNLDLFYKLSLHMCVNLD